MSYPEPLQPRPSRAVNAPQPTGPVYSQPIETYSTEPRQPERKRGLRKFSWFILAVQVLFLIWIIGGVSSAKADNCGTLDQASCEAATGIGTAIGAGLVIVLWAVVDVILLVIWLVTRPRQR